MPKQNAIFFLWKKWVMSVKNILMHSPSDADRPQKDSPSTAMFFVVSEKKKDQAKKTNQTLIFVWQMVFNLQKKEL